jgi:hypothetical protein
VGRRPGGANRSRLSAASHGDLPEWLSVLGSLPDLPAAAVALNEAQVRVDSARPLDQALRDDLYESLQELHP